jgi:hypothetical protein
MQVPVDPFETESLASLFAKVGLDKTDVLLLGEEFSVTLKSLAEMPDEVSSVLAFETVSLTVIVNIGDQETPVPTGQNRCPDREAWPVSGLADGREGTRAKTQGERRTPEGEGRAREAGGGAGARARC